MSKRTQHGGNIADQIQGEDAYGIMGNLTYADLYNIIDQFQTHIMDTQPDDQILYVLSSWMEKLIELDPDIELP